MSTPDQWQARARKYLSTSAELIRLGDYESAVSRAYYAMFYMATAVLQKQGLTAKSHKGTLHLFAEHFIKTGILPRESLTDFRNVFDERLLAEYDADFSFSQQEVEQILDKANRFTETVAAHIAGSG